MSQILRLRFVLAALTRTRDALDDLLDKPSQTTLGRTACAVALERTGGYRSDDPRGGVAKLCRSAFADDEWGEILRDAEELSLSLRAQSR